MELKFNILKNPVDDFAAKWVDSDDVMQMLLVSRRTTDDYIKVCKLTPTRINKRNQFAINQVQGLIDIPEVLKISTLQKDIQRMIKAMASLKEKCDLFGMLFLTHSKDDTLFKVQLPLIFTLFIV